MAKVIIIGPAYPLRGGLATFDHRLAKAFQDAGHECCIYSFSLQYPSFLFPGKTQFSDEPAPEGITIKTLINSINPLNWISVGRKLRKENADLVVVRFWLPFMGPALGSIIRRLNHKRTKVICIADNAIPHEKRIGDRPFSNYLFNACDGFVAMSDKVFEDLKQFPIAEKPKVILQHPLYDNFGEKLSKAAAKEHLGIEVSTPILLFFGFIRKYKGLDLLLDAFGLFKKEYPNGGHKLLIAGEFYEDETSYLAQIESSGIAKDVILRTVFIPDSEVRYYLSAADVLVQSYKQATQSGVTPLAYYFEVPMVVTNVGGLPALVPHEKSGIVAEPDPKSICEGIAAYYRFGDAHFIPHLQAEKQKLSWETFVSSIETLSKNIES